MPCYNPRTVSFDRYGKIAFSPKHFAHELVPFKVPCGKCIACRLEYSKQWAIRCVHESDLHAKSCFVTLTYDNDHIPPNGSLLYEDFRLFFKRLRNKYGKGIGYFMCGEYGETHGRPHYHALIFGHDFQDKQLKRQNAQGNECYTSTELDDLWKNGRTELGSVTFESAAYVARYITKKITGEAAAEHYQGLTPEFAKMSTKYAIGKKWLEKYYEDIFNSGRLTIRGGHTSSIPRYYEKWLLKFHKEIYEQHKIRKALFRPTEQQIIDNTPQRNKVKSKWHKLIIRQLKRNLDSEI